MLFHPSLNLVRSWSDNASRYVQCEFTFQDSCFRVLCIYAPNRNPAHDLFFNQLDTLVDPASPTVLCGDFNTVFDRSLDRAGSSLMIPLVRVLWCSLGSSTPVALPPFVKLCIYLV